MKEYKGYTIRTKGPANEGTTTSARAKKKGQSTIFSKTFSGSSAERRAMAHCRRLIDQREA